MEIFWMVFVAVMIFSTVLGVIWLGSEITNLRKRMYAFRADFDRRMGNVENNSEIRAYLMDDLAKELGYEAFYVNQQPGHWEWRKEE